MIEAIDMVEIWAVVIGGLISAATTIICFIWEYKHSKRAEQERTRLEQKQWKRDHTLSVYLEIASALEKIIIPIDETGIIVNKEYKKWLDELQSVIERNRGKLALFASHDISNRLTKFQAELYELSTTHGKNIQEYGDFNDASIVLVIKHAWQIEDMLKKELFE